MQQVYKNITPDMIAAFREKAAAAGMIVPVGNTGEISTHGVTMKFLYDGTSTLTLIITNKPFFIPASMIWGELQPYIPIAA